MVDQKDTRLSNTNPTANSSQLGGRRGMLIALIAAALVAGIAAGFSWRHFGMRDSGAFGALPSQAQIDQRIDFMTKQLGSEVGATADQQAKIANIAKSAAADLRAMVQKAEAARGQAVALLSAPTIDRAAIERLVVDQIALAEAATKRIGQLLVDAAEVLTPEQRRKLGDWILREGPWARWYRG